jgi:ABC-type Fe3+-siderophore transport system permease subunit
MSLAIIAWILAIVALLLGVYYLIPNVYHPLAEPDPTAMHVKHAIAFFAVAVVLFFGGRFMRNSQSVT